MKYLYSKIVLNTNFSQSSLSLASKILGLGLVVFGLCVIAAWHLLTVQDLQNNFLLRTGYHTALCIIISGVLLTEIFRDTKLFIVSAITLMLLLSGLKLIELTVPEISVIAQFFLPNTADQSTIGGIQSTSAICFFLIGLAALLRLTLKTDNHPIILLTPNFLILIVLSIALVGVLSAGLGVIPGFVWLHIKIAPLTSLCIIFYCVSILLNTQSETTTAFNRLNILKRIFIGLLFLSFVAIAITSVSLMEISNVTNSAANFVNNYSDASEIAQDALYQAEYNAKKTVLFLMVTFLIIGLIVAIAITKSITTQLKKIQRAMMDLTQGKTQESLPFLDQAQEIGEIARTLETFARDASEVKAAEAQLQQVIEAMPNGVIRVSAKGIIEIVNHQTEKIFGYSREELIGKPIELLIPKKYSGEHPKNRDGFFSQPTTRSMGAGRELFGLQKNGHEVPVEIGLAPLKVNDELKVLASIVDITERVNAERALKESSERLELATRVNAIGVWEFNFDSQKLIWNDAMFEIYGRNKDLFGGDYAAWRNCVHPDDLEETEKLLNACLQNLTNFVSKFRIIKPDGSIRHIYAKAKTERIVNSSELRMLGTNIDITREEVAYAKMHELESLRSSIVEFSEDAIISKTPLGIITSWNKGAERIFGFTADEVIGKDITSVLFPPDRVHEEEMLLSQVRAGSVIQHFETIRRRKDGKDINVSVTLSPIKNKFGRVVGASAIKRDITEYLNNAKLLQKRQDLLEKSNLDLEKINKELQNFAYIASHDLRSPLRGVAQLSTWIEEDLALQDFEKVRQHTTFLRGRIARMEKLLDDLLRYYRAGRNSGSLGEVDLNFLVRELFELQNTQKGFELKIPRPLPTLVTYVPPLEQIIRNLISNALKHHDRESGSICITTQQISDDFTEINITDDGPGIPSQYHQKVFEIFQTLKTRDEMESSGIGLSLVKKILESVGGSIRIESTGRGTSFIFSWPLKISSNNQTYPDTTEGKINE